MQIGMCNGMPQRKRPTALGQADYYGVVANTAARIMALAKPGRTWIEGHLPFDTRQRGVYDVPHALEVDLLGGDTREVGTIRLEPRGWFNLKGLPKPTPIFEVRTRRAARRVSAYSARQHMLRGRWPVCLRAAEHWCCTCRSCGDGLH